MTDDGSLPPRLDGGGEEPARGEAHERARKINPMYTEGRLVRVAGGRNLAEAELIQGMLLEEGVPSVLRRTRGFDVPDFLAAGPRDILVPEAGVEVAREVLHEADMAPPEDDGSPQPRQVIAVTLAIFAAGGLVAGVAWLLTQASG